MDNVCRVRKKIMRGFAEVYITPSTIGPRLLNPQTTKPIILPLNFSKPAK